VKIFIDLGAFTGDTLQLALSQYSDFDRFHAFEPFSINFEKLYRAFGSRENVVLHRAAADVTDGKRKLFLHNAPHLYPDTGHTLLGEKADVSPETFELVDCVDFSRFVIDTFSPSDTIILKIDIEGMEYDVLSTMIRHGSIRYISRIFCEWHPTRAKIGKKRHQELVRELQGLGFDLSGVNRRDEYSRVLNRSTDDKKDSRFRALIRLLLRFRSRAREKT
jgi:FkbM family methyltransferase